MTEQRLLEFDCQWSFIALYTGWKELEEVIKINLEISQEGHSFYEHWPEPWLTLRWLTLSPVTQVQECSMAYSYLLIKPL